MSDSPRTLRRYGEALDTFLAAYRDYLQAGPGHPELRRRAVDATTAAHQALHALGFDVMMMPPPALGGYPVRGLHNVAFQHEHSTWGEPQVAIDVVTAAQARVRMLLEEARRRRWNPFYWGDRILRAILGFPIYLVSLVFRVPPGRLDASPWGTVVQVVGIVVEVALVVVGGRQVGWW